MSSCRGGIIKGTPRELLLLLLLVVIEENWRRVEREEEEEEEEEEACYHRGTHLFAPCKRRTTMD